LVSLEPDYSRVRDLLLSLERLRSSFLLLVMLFACLERFYSSLNVLYPLLDVLDAFLLYKFANCYYCDNELFLACELSLLYTFAFFSFFDALLI